MTACRLCGVELREADETVEADGHLLHVGCTAPHAKPPRRKVGLWAAMGSEGQMAMGDVQRDTPT
jgi:hypothetical protein